MLSLFKPYKWWILGIGGLVVAGASSYASYNLTKTWYTNHYTAIITKKEKEFSDYKDAQKHLRDQADSFSRETQKRNSDLILDLTNQVRDLETKNTELTNEVKNVTNRRLRDVAAGRGMFIDKGKTTTACPRDSDSTAIAGKTQIEPARPRELSRETTEFLLEYAESAELTRKDLNTQLEYSDKLRQTYDAMRQNYQNLADYVKGLSNH